MDKSKDYKSSKDDKPKTESKSSKDSNIPKGAVAINTKDDKTAKKPEGEENTSAAPKMIEVYVNDRVGRKVRVKCW